MCGVIHVKGQIAHVAYFGEKLKKLSKPEYKAR